MTRPATPYRPWAIASGYAIVASVGALLSHWATGDRGLPGGPSPLLHRLMDIAFALVTAGVLYLILRQQVRRVEQTALARLEAARLADSPAIKDAGDGRTPGIALCEAVRRVSGASLVAWFRLDPAARELSLCESCGFPGEIPESVRAQLVFREDDPGDVVGDVTKSRNPSYVPDTAAEPRWRGLNPGLRSAFLVPVAFGDRLFGVLVAFSGSVDGIRPDQREHIASFAEDAGTSFELSRRLATAESALASLEAAQDRLVRQERLRALGVLASGIAHDVNNALTPILGYSELLLAPGGLDRTDRVRSQLESIQTAGRDAGEIVTRLRDVCRDRVGDPAPVSVDLHALSREVIALTAPRWRDAALRERKTVAVRPEDHGAPPVLADPARLREALVNLVFNAVDAIPGEGSIVIRSRPDGAGAVLEVHDDGAGMTESVRRRAGEPFFTTKGERGTGMGLMMVRQGVESFGGRMEIDSAPGRGTTIRLRFQAPG